MLNILNRPGKNQVTLQCTECNTVLVKYTSHLNTYQCKTCRINKKIDTIEQICSQVGFAFDRTTYKDSRTPVTITCPKGHINYTRPDNLYPKFRIECSKCAKEIDTQKRLDTEQKKLQQKANRPPKKPARTRSELNKLIRRKNYNKFFEIHNGCQVCGEKRYSCIDFHHVNGNTKKYLVSDLMQSKLNQRLYDELDKCCMLCSNCHMLFHRGGLDITFIKHPILGYIVEKYQYINANIPQYKNILCIYDSFKQCCSCNNKNLSVLEYHHVKPSEKRCMVSALGYIRKKTANEDIAKLLLEANKTIGLCRNCHQAFEHNELQLQFVKIDMGYLCIP